MVTPTISIRCDVQRSYGECSESVFTLRENHGQRRDHTSSRATLFFVMTQRVRPSFLFPSFFPSFLSFMILRLRDYHKVSFCSWRLPASSKNLGRVSFSVPKTLFFQSRRTFLKHICSTIANRYVDRAVSNPQKTCVH